MPDLTHLSDKDAAASLAAIQDIAEGDIRCKRVHNTGIPPWSTLALVGEIERLRFGVPPAAPPVTEEPFSISVARELLRAAGVEITFRCNLTGPQIEELAATVKHMLREKPADYESEIEGRY